MHLGTPEILWFMIVFKIVFNIIITHDWTDPIQSRTHWKCVQNATEESCSCEHAQRLYLSCLCSIKLQSKHSRSANQVSRPLASHCGKVSANLRYLAMSAQASAKRCEWRNMPQGTVKNSQCSILDHPRWEPSHDSCQHDRTKDCLAAMS